MGRHSRTKDETFILCAYETAQKLGNVDAEMNRYMVGKLAGLKERATDAITKLLVKSNFIKRLGETDFRLTSNGQALAQRLLGE